MDLANPVGDVLLVKGCITTTPIAYTSDFAGARLSVLEVDVGER
jgi:hypothetical protein